MAAKSKKIKLNELSCPFTWELCEMAVSCCNLGNSDEVEENDIELLAIMQHLVKCYENVTSANPDAAGAELQTAEECFERIRKSGESHYIIRTLEHIVYATKCHFLYEQYNERGVETILKDIVDVSNFTVKEHGALEGFKSAAYSFYFDFGIEKAIDAAKKAVKKNEENAVWHFILAKNLRRKRRLLNVRNYPCLLEKEHFEKAYVISHSPTCGIYYAQMKWESQFKKKTRISKFERNELEKQLLHIYKLILNSQTKNCNVLLKTALGYIRISNSDALIEADRCLDAVDKVRPNNPATLHYRGLIRQKRGKNQEALHFFKQAGDLYNFVADINYAELGWKVGSVNPADHLLKMETKYSDLVGGRLQKLYLQIATSYVSCDEHSNAAKYYLKAIDVDPDASQLNGYFKFLNVVHKDGVYHFLQQNFLPSFVQVKHYRTLPDVIDQLNERCLKHFNKAAVKGIEGQLRNGRI